MIELFRRRCHFRRLSLRSHQFDLVFTAAAAAVAVAVLCLRIVDAKTDKSSQVSSNADRLHASAVAEINAEGDAVTSASVSAFRATPRRTSQGLLRAEVERGELETVRHELNLDHRRISSVAEHERVHMLDKDADGENLATTTPFEFHPTATGWDKAFIMVWPYTGLPTTGVTEDMFKMRCVSGNDTSGNDTSRILRVSNANTRPDCMYAAEADLARSKDDTRPVRGFQFCDDCEEGKRCELVFWCLDVEVNPVKEWRLLRVSQEMPDMWGLAAQSTMCTLPPLLMEALKVESGALFEPDGALASNHQLACQEWALKLNFSYYQFCGTCRLGRRCRIMNTCEKCVSLAQTDWHVFASQTAAPPCNAPGTDALE
eukprot:TRINITY_DN70382_c0_g1_i1.p1 TRINITY_DN70382_c0_g1~~TRINITY_DN70382_c0_g1_i1.p1  ORF type:complete len:373 (+),score=65.17 TRINITY_DN70382_c0_g1_i1:196-1314(+)